MATERLGVSQPDTTHRSESDAESGPTAEGRGREYVSKAASSLWRGAESGTLPAIVGGTGVLSGLRALLGGDRERGLTRIVVGAALLAVAATQRRSGGRSGAADVEASDVVDTGPDLETVADEAGGVGEDEHATGDAAAEVVDTSPDIEDARSERESESSVDAGSASVDQRDVVDTGVGSGDLAEATEQESGGGSEAAETGAVDRLGEAAFDGQSREVPVPQQAFNRGFLSHSSEAFWGIRTADDAVLVSRDYDAVQDPDGVQYVASSEIGADARELPIPNAVLTHWNDVLGDGTAVAGGDDVMFVTTDDLADEHLLRVVPAEWADDALGEE